MSQAMAQLLPQSTYGARPARREKRRAGAKGLHLVPATFLGSKAVDRRALLAGVRSRIHMPAIRYSMVSSWLVRPITSANMARQLLSKAAAYTSNKFESELQAGPCTVSVP